MNRGCPNHNFIRLNEHEKSSLGPTDGSREDGLLQRCFSSIDIEIIRGMTKKKDALSNKPFFFFAKGLTQINLSNLF